MVIIIGAGVSGLTTGIALLETGYSNVKIVAVNLPPHTTSNKAAAIWFPYQANPQDLVLKWSMESYVVLEALSHQIQTGIHMVDWCVLEQLSSGQTPWWTVGLPPHAYRKAAIEELPKGYTQGFMTHVPMIETPIYMSYLLQQFEAMGGQIEVRKVESIEGLLKENPQAVIVNCSGLGAKKLCDDEALFPIQGHIVQVETTEQDFKKIGYLADEDGVNSMGYMMPRKDCVILGGTVEAHQSSLEVDESVVADILRRCQNLQPKLKGRKVLDTYVGLRPGRSVIRLEKEKGLPIVHNYGHGGSGFTVSWGCAKEAVRLVSECKMLR
ncbi:MAG: FAD-dependent oxidoreductase [Chitinophagales bacterium]